jgi:hypothetical protein
MSEPVARHFRALGRKSQRLSARISEASGGSVPPGDAPSGVEGLVVDLGLGGACLELSERYEPGRALRVLLELPGLWDPLELSAEVAWRGTADKDGKVLVGVRFVQPSGKSLRLLSEALAGDHL